MARNNWEIPPGLLRQPAFAARRDLAAADWFSFDIFDTLVKRDTASFTNLLHLVADRAGLDPQAFVAARSYADRVAQQSDPDYTLGDIYRHLEGFDEAQRARAMACEVDLEIALSAPNSKIIPLYEQTIASGLPVVLISDMYLPEVTIREILAHAGIEGFADLFVSSTCRASKRDGGLFTVAAKTMNRPLGGLVHIGDSPRRDFMMPRTVGARSILVRRRLAHQGISPRSRALRKWDGGSLVTAAGDAAEARISADLRTFLANRSSGNASSPFNVFGYNALGPMLFGFSQWLDSQCAAQDLDHAVFVARDGLILQRAFEAHRAAPGIRCTYLKASRQSLRLAAFAGREERLPAELFFATPSLSATQVLAQLGLAPLQASEILSTLNLDSDEQFDRESYRTSDSFQRLFDAALPLIRDHCAEQRQLLGEYLDQLGVRGRIALVDSGWSGTIQAYLQEGSDDILEIDGFYLGIASGIRERLRVTSLRAHGYLADFSRGDSDGYLLDVMLGFIEAWLYAPHGSTKGYKRHDDGRIEVLLAPMDNGDQTGNSLIMQAQDAALRFIADYADSPLSARNLPASAAFGRVEAVALSPSRPFLSGFGELTNNGQRLAPKPTVQHLLSPSALKLAFAESRWKSAFLKRTLRLPFPYNRLYLAGLRRGMGTPSRRRLDAPVHVRPGGVT